MKRGNINFLTKSIKLKTISATNIFTLQSVTHFLIYLIKSRNIKKQIYIK